MKKNLLLASFAICGFAKAQITVTQNDIPLPGTIAIMAKDTANFISEGPSGPSRTWDFTALKNQAKDTLRYLSPNGIPGASAFPSSNLVLKQFDASSKNYSYAFAKVNSSRLDLLGFSGTIFGQAIKVVYSPAANILTFPLTYNSTQNGKSTTTIALAYPAPPMDSLKVVSAINYATLVDSWGSVTSPSGTSASLRLRRISNSIDSTFTHSATTKKWAWDGSAPSNKTDTTYQWWANGKGNNVVEVDLKFKSTPAKTGSYLLATVLGLSEIMKTSEVLLFPNPANGTLNIRMEDGINASSVEFSNILGEKVLNTVLNGTISKIDVSKLPKGIYTYQIKNEATVLKMGKVIIE